MYPIYGGFHRGGVPQPRAPVREPFRSSVRGSLGPQEAFFGLLGGQRSAPDARPPESVERMDPMQLQEIRRELQILMLGGVAFVEALIILALVLRR